MVPGLAAAPRGSSGAAEQQPSAGAPGAAGGGGSPPRVIDGPRMPITMASAVTIVMLGKLLGAALRGPVGAIFGGFMALVFTSASVPVTRRFVWIVRRGGRQGVIGPFFFTDERAIQQHRALENEGCRLVRLVHLDDQWLIDQRSGTIG